jgi:hypothetical protein
VDIQNKTEYNKSIIILLVFWGGYSVMDLCLVVGVEEYHYLSNATCAKNDALVFHQIMNDVFKVKYVSLHIKTVTHYVFKKAFDQILDKLEKEDRLIFFFAGHGANFRHEPYIAMYDSNPDELTETYFNLVALMAQANQKGCAQCLFFIDACESTVSMGSNKRSSKTISTFHLDQIRMGLSNTTSSLIFSSTSHKEEASIMPDKNHGIWSYFLMQALSGKATEALKEGVFLTDNSLQTYLNHQVKDYCKTSSVSMQTPFRWGKSEGEFLINEFPQANIVAYDEIPPSKIRDVRFISITTKGVKRLSGFQKGYRVPSWVNATTQGFAQSLAIAEITVHMDAVSRQIIDFFEFGPDDFQYGIEKGYGYFNCDYFEYEYSVELVETDTVHFTAQLRPIDAGVLVYHSTDIDHCFIEWFDCLEFSFRKAINLKDLVKNYRSSNNPIIEEYKLEASPDFKEVILYHKETGREIKLTAHSLEIHFQRRETMGGLFSSLPEISSHLQLVSSELKLLD